MEREMWRNWKEKREGNYNQNILCEKKNVFFNKRKIKNMVSASLAFIFLSRENSRMLVHSDPHT